MKNVVVFFLVLVGVIGLMAAPIQPPGVAPPERVWSGYELRAVTPDTVLTAALLTREQFGHVLAIPAHRSNAGMPQDYGVTAVFAAGPGLRLGPPQSVDFPLLC